MNDPPELLFEVFSPQLESLKQGLLDSEVTLFNSPKNGHGFSGLKAAEDVEVTDLEDPTLTSISGRVSKVEIHNGEVYAFIPEGSLEHGARNDFEDWIKLSKRTLITFTQK